MSLQYLLGERHASGYLLLFVILLIKKWNVVLSKNLPKTKIACPLLYIQSCLHYFDLLRDVLWNPTIVHVTKYHKSWSPTWTESFCDMILHRKILEWNVCEYSLFPIMQIVLKESLTIWFCKRFWGVGVRGKTSPNYCPWTLTWEEDT